ncbi:MAG: transporter suffix domain-containing protein [Proteobacteria bacterium]|nr:transporter suffix domain-containing protein [Pseudomonadota bacterium]
MSVNKRFYLGIILLVIGLIMPFGMVFVAKADLPIAVKTAISGILFFGFEITAVPAVAVMGKENFDRIMSRVKGWLGSLKPAGNIGKIRHCVGIAMFLLPIIPTYIMSYAPRWLPDNSPWRLWVSIVSDAVFLASLFVLGGGFWDKLRSLFIREARAVFPEDVSRKR